MLDYSKLQGQWLHAEFSLTQVELFNVKSFFWQTLISSIHQKPKSNNEIIGFNFMFFILATVLDI